MTTTKWRGDGVDDYYWFIDKDGYPATRIDCLSSLDTERYNIGNYYQTNALVVEAIRDRVALMDKFLTNY